MSRLTVVAGSIETNTGALIGVSTGVPIGASTGVSIGASGVST